MEDIGAIQAIFSGLLVYVSIAFLYEQQTINTEQVPATHITFFWLVVISVNIIATILEILYLYVDSLRAAALIAGYFGLDPWLIGYPINMNRRNYGDRRRYVNDMDHAATAIVRAGIIY